MSQKRERKKKAKPIEKERKKTWVPTYDTFLGWWWNDAAVERLLDRQLLIETQKITITPPHREDFTPEHCQGSLKEDRDFN